MSEKVWLFRIKGEEHLRYVPIEVSRVPTVGEHIAWAAGTEVDAGGAGANETTTNESHYRVIKVIHIADRERSGVHHVAEVFAVEDNTPPF